MKRLISKKKAFTLVELLIVIALIAILSVAVLATINPIEQTNKARDAKFKNNAAEVLGSLERYYASQNAYTWNLYGNTVASTWSGAYDSTAPEFGVVGGSGPNFTDGPLITSSELKGSFRGNEPFASPVLDTDHMYVYHNAGSNSNYVCFTPKATANRTGAMALQLKCLSTVGAGASLVDLGNGCTQPATWTTDIGASNANLLCVPDGKIN